MMEAVLTSGELSGSVLLAFFRISSFFVASPFPGPRVPATVRIMLSGGVAWAIAPAGGPAAFGWTDVLSEVILGLAAGFLLQLVLQTFTFAGEAGGTQMGLANPGFIDPMQDQSTIMGSTFSLIALTVFALGEGPGRLLVFLSRSFDLIPLGGLSASLPTAAIAAEAGTAFFAAGIRVAAPLIAAVFCAQLVIMVIARSVPTLNMMVEGPSLTVGTGILGLVATVQTFSTIVDQLFTERFEDIARWLSV